MENKFVKTKNFKNFVSLASKLKNLPDNIPRLALLYSEPGIGKTHMLLKWALDNDAVYIRAINGMTQPGLLKNIVTDLDLTDYHNMQTNFNHIVKCLQNEPRVIIVDEVDYLIGDKNVIEILRDIQDMTNVPIILSGMEFVNRKIARFKHIKSRLYKSLKLKYYDENEIKDILEQLTNLQFTDGAIKYLALRKVPFRQIVQTIQELESYSQTNNIREINETTLDKDYKDAYSYARALLAADGVKNPSNQQVNNKANEILVANGNIKFKKGTKVQIAAKAPDSKFVQDLSNNGFKPTRENAIFYNRFNALNPSQQQNVLSVIKYCRSQKITDPNKIKARILETFPEINLFDSGKLIPMNSSFGTPAFQRKNPVALETFLTETLKLLNNFSELKQKYREYNKNNLAEEALVINTPEMKQLCEDLHKNYPNLTRISNLLRIAQEGGYEKIRHMLDNPTEQNVKDLKEMHDQIYWEAMDNVVGLNIFKLDLKPQQLLSLAGKGNNLKERHLLDADKKLSAQDIYDMADADNDTYYKTFPKYSHLLGKMPASTIMNLRENLDGYTEKGLLDYGLNSATMLDYFDKNPEELGNLKQNKDYQIIAKYSGDPRTYHYLIRKPNSDGVNWVKDIDAILNASGNKISENQRDLIKTVTEYMKAAINAEGENVSNIMNLDIAKDLCINFEKYGLNVAQTLNIIRNSNQPLG